MVLSCSDRVLSDCLDLLSCVDMILAIMGRSDQTKRQANNRSVKPINQFDKVFMIENHSSTFNGKENQSHNGNGSKEMKSSMISMNSEEMIRKRMPSFEICETNYSKDGVLLDPAAISSPLLQFIFKELQCRKFLRSKNVLSSGINDNDGLIAQLQRSECHLLACRVISSSWCMAIERDSNVASQVIFFSCILPYYHA